MTRDELIEHMISDHAITNVNREDRDTEALIAQHASDHESVISIALGLADHQHSEYLEVDGMPAFPE